MPRLAERPLNDAVVETATRGIARRPALRSGAVKCLRLLRCRATARVERSAAVRDLALPERGRFHRARPHLAPPSACSAQFGEGELLVPPGTWPCNTQAQHGASRRPLRPIPRASAPSVLYGGSPTSAFRLLGEGRRQLHGERRPRRARRTVSVLRPDRPLLRRTTTFALDLEQRLDGLVIVLWHSPLYSNTESLGRFGRNRALVCALSSATGCPASGFHRAERCDVPRPGRGRGMLLEGLAAQALGRPHLRAAEPRSTISSSSAPPVPHLAAHDFAGSRRRLLPASPAASEPAAAPSVARGRLGAAQRRRCCVIRALRARMSSTRAPMARATLRRPTMRRGRVLQG